MHPNDSNGEAWRDNAQHWLVPPVGDVPKDPTILQATGALNDTAVITNAMADVSPGALVIAVLDKVGFSPGKFISDWLSGDWNKVWRAGEAARFLGHWAAENAGDLQSLAESMAGAWQGPAHDAADGQLKGAEQWFDGAATKFWKVADALQNCAKFAAALTEVLRLLINEVCAWIADRLLGAWWPGNWGEIVDTLRGEGKIQKIITNCTRAYTVFQGLGKALDDIDWDTGDMTVPSLGRGVADTSNPLAPKPTYGPWAR